MRPLTWVHVWSSSVNTLPDKLNPPSAKLVELIFSYQLVQSSPNFDVKDQNKVYSYINWRQALLEDDIIIWKVEYFTNSFQDRKGNLWGNLKCCSPKKWLRLFPVSASWNFGFYLWSVIISNIWLFFMEHYNFKYLGFINGG